MILGTRLRSRWHGLSDHAQVGLALLAVALGLLGWGLFWPIPTEVSGEGVLIYPDNAGLIDARAAGQVRRLLVKVGDRVRRGQVLIELYLPVLERELQQQARQPGPAGAPKPRPRSTRCPAVGERAPEGGSGPGQARR
jgi:multidrug efflux pump subunit AcrA (membrane-fusion protein)